ncbi:MAG: response regulator [Desulfobacterales bacterium]|nr:response regulator [Desulfobacterales bacterium]
MRGEGKILLMDDEEMVLKVVGQMLSRLGYEAEFSRDGDEAVKLYRKAKESGDPFAAVIMDLTIPGGIGGKEAIGKVLEIDPNVKAIVSSGYSIDPIMADYRKHGFSGVIVKPVQMKELSDTLQNVIGGRN